VELHINGFMWSSRLCGVKVKIAGKTALSSALNST